MKQKNTTSRTKSLGSNTFDYPCGMSQYEKESLVGEAKLAEMRKKKAIDRKVEATIAYLEKAQYASMSTSYLPQPAKRGPYRKRAA
jgi:hypothetical protein